MVESVLNENHLKDIPNSVQQTSEQKKKVLYKNENIIAFRANDVELVLLNQLQKAWQLPNFSAVLHKLLASYHGVVKQREDELHSVRQMVSKWQYSEWEVFKKD